MSYQSGLYSVQNYYSQEYNLFEMYYLYQQDVEDYKTVFKRLERISLAGRISGLIARYLKKIINSSVTEPHAWHVASDKLFNILGLPGNTLVIDVKPNSKKELSLFKIKLRNEDIAKVRQAEEFAKAASV